MELKSSIENFNCDVLFFQKDLQMMTAGLNFVLQSEIIEFAKKHVFFVKC